MWRRRRRPISSEERSSGTRAHRIKTLSLQPDHFFNEIFVEGSEHTQSPSRIKELIRFTPEYLSGSPRYRRLLGNALVGLLSKTICEKEKRYYGKFFLHNNQYPYLIDCCDPFIDEHTKSNIADLIIKYNCNFSYQSRKLLFGLAIKYLNNSDTRAVDLFKCFYRSLSPKEFDKIISIVPDGMDNGGIKEVFGKTKMFDYLKFNEEAVNNSLEEKIKLTQAIANTTTLVKKLPFVLTINKEHIKKISPVLRLKFVQFAFKHEIYQSRYGYNIGANLNNRIGYSKRRAKEDKLVVEPITAEEMKEILFSVCLHKNEEFSKWINNYRLYLDCLKAIEKVDMSKYR